jgi:hypothetical protein
MSTRSGCRYQLSGDNRNALNNAVNNKRIKDEHFKLIPSVVRNTCRYFRGDAHNLWVDWDENNIFFTAKQARKLWEVVTQVLTNQDRFQDQFAHAIFSRMLDFWNLDEQSDKHVGFCYYAMNKSVPDNENMIINFKGVAMRAGL